MGALHHDKLRLRSFKNRLKKGVVPARRQNLRKPVFRCVAGLGGRGHDRVIVQNNPVNWRDPLGLWSVTFGGYAGPGFEISFGVDSGTPFATGRIGLGIGGGITWDKNGGIPGPSIKNTCKGGVLSASVAGNLTAGPLSTNVEVGDARNYANEESSFYGTKSATGLSTTIRGLGGTISIGAQGTYYGGL